MDFQHSPRAQEYLTRLQSFMDAAVLPAEPVYAAQRRELAAAGRPHELPPVVEDLKAQARAAGLWNLFLPDSTDPAHGLTVLDYAPLAELSGWSPELAPEALNCAAPDTGNMEILHMFGTPEQKEQWLDPLLAGEIRSGVLDDRAGGRQQRRAQHRDPDRARRRRVRHQRPQVVDHRGDRPALPGPDRHGQDRPATPTCTTSSRWSWCRSTPPGSRSCATCRCSATTTSTGTPRSPSPTCACR